MLYTLALYISSFFVPREPTRTYGWIADTPDARDFYYNFMSTSHDHITMVDMRSECPDVYDQGRLGSCTAQALGALFEFDELRAYVHEEVFRPSRLFIYYNEREMEGHVNQDAGAEIRDGMKSLSTFGVCPETLWPYNIAMFTTHPSEECYTQAKETRALEYHRVEQTLPQLKAALIDKNPIVFGYLVFESFETPEVAQTGNMPMPREGERVLGGHAVLIVGFDDSREVFIVRNSWGERWGDHGYFYMPYEFALNPEYCSDFWILTTISEDED